MEGWFVLKNMTDIKSTNFSPSISIIVLTLNEVKNVGLTVNTIIKSTEKHDIKDYEIIIVDGGSIDSTQQIIGELALNNNHIKGIYNHGKMGVGHDFKSGLAHASKEYVGWFPGDDETLPETIDTILEQIGKTDIIIPYTVNIQVRSLYRRLLSSTYTLMFNILFGLRLKYFNGPCFFRHDLLKTIIMSTDSPAFMAEILIQLIKRNNVSYLEVPMYIRARDYGKTNVLKWKNVYFVGKTMISLIRKIYF